MNILLKSARIVNEQSQDLHLKKRDILIKNGIIEKIASKIDPSRTTKVVNLKNLHVSLGWFDSSVSFGEPGFEERETITNGLNVAAKSGFTDIVLNPNTNPVPDSSSDIVFIKNAAESSATSLYPIGSLTMKSRGIDLAELYDMGNVGAVGYSDFKSPITNSNLLKIALQYVQNFDGLVYSQPLDTKIAGKGMVNEGPVSTKLGLKGIPALGEELQIARDLFILQYTGGKLHIPTISTANAVKLIADAKKKGLDVSCSVAVHNLVFTDEVLEEFDTAYKVMPPLRSKKDSKALIKGLKDGVVDFVTSDHTPLNVELKRVEFDNAAYGAIGLESAFGLLNKTFGAEICVGLLTKGRERYDIEENKLSEGHRACLTLFDPDEEYNFEKNNIISTSKNSMAVGQTLKGKVYGIVNKNQLILA
ncbi:dihydroorotase [Maribacter sp. HTCC2170]|uniref:dihydroorotase n=1 Tax=Maribacter sp. (strain HTCC2170 / KCCM 42371) TaxID=313603 RepID=UPI00006B21F8|nr:dihydroorotase [Maribacter sp. HTCC2170]EAR00264.1 dihydroorotase [Maribacter sp. HTCC2170]